MPEPSKRAQSDDWMMPSAGAAGDENGVWSDDLERPLPSARGVLTAAEIEALLRPDLPDDLPIPPEPSSIIPKTRADFDTDQTPIVSDQEARLGRLSSKLSLAFGQNTGIKAAFRLDRVEEVQQAELTAALSGKTGAVACYGASERETNTLLCLDEALADAMIANACGAQGSTGRLGDAWTLSAIDSALLEQLSGGLVSAFEDGMSLQAIETDLPYVASLMPRGALAVARYHVEAPGLRSQLTLVMPLNLVTESPHVEPSNIARLAPQTAQKVTALATARIARLTVPLSRLTALKAGSTLLLGLPTDQPVEVLSGDRNGPVAFEGEVGRKGNKVAVRITRRRSGVLD